MTPRVEPTRSLFAASFGLALVLGVLLAARGEAAWSLAVAPLAVLLVAGLALQARAPGSSRALLALAILNGLLTVPELALRVADFRFVSGIQFGYPTPEDFQEFEPDAELFWKLPPGDPGVNSLGFLGPELSVPKPPGVHRVLFLGDSCLQQGYPESVPDIVAHLAGQARGPELPRFESVNLSMSGYSSYQGLRAAELIGLQLGPDLVVVYFGWNDHWRAYGAIDSEKTVALERDLLLRRSRLLQAVRRIAAVAGLTQEARPLPENRVPRDQYAGNLARISRLFGEQGIPVLFVAAPSSHTSRGVPDYLVRRGFAPTAADVLREHAEYNDTLRAVARTAGDGLLDLAAELEDSFAAGQDPRGVFVEDGIHFNESGRWIAAERLVEHLEQAGLDGRERAR